MSPLSTAPLPTQIASTPVLKKLGAHRGALLLEEFSGHELSRGLNLWRALDERLQNQSLFCGCIWTETWLEHFHEFVVPRILIARRGEEVRGAVLVVESRQLKDGPFSVRTVHWGTAGEPSEDSAVVEFNSLLCFPEDRVEFQQQISREMLTDRRWEAWKLEGFTRDDLAQFLIENPDAEIDSRSTCYIDLAPFREPGASLYETYSTATKRNLRRQFKNYNGYQSEWATSVHHAESIYSDLVVLHQERWNAAGEPGVYASPAFYKFHKALITKLVPLGKAVLHRVTHGKEVVGCTHYFIDRNRVLNYQGGHEPYQPRWSPGQMTDFVGIEESIRRGYTAYDYMAGISKHKQNLTNAVGELLWVTIRRPSWKHSLTNWYRNWKRWWNEKSRTPSVSWKDRDLDEEPRRSQETQEPNG